MSLLLEGLGSNNLILLGLGQFEAAAATFANEVLRARLRGGSNSRRRDDEDTIYVVNVGTKLLEVNGVLPLSPVKGYVRVEFNDLQRPKVTVIESKVRARTDHVYVRVERVAARRAKATVTANLVEQPAEHGTRDKVRSTDGQGT